MLTTVLSFLLTLAVLIVVHEWGHYRMARACGVKVLRFSIGFGRPLWRRMRGETEWVVALLPLGGYVKMLDEREGAVLPAERDRAFNRKALWQRALIVAAGPVANLVLAVLLYAAADWIGTSEPRAVLATPPSGSVAEAAGIQPGDWVRATSVEDGEWDDVASLTDLRWVLTRAALDGEDVRLRITQPDGRGAREVLLPLSLVGGGDADANLMRRIGVGQPYAPAVIGRVMAGGAGQRAGLREGDRVLSVDGRAVVDGAALRMRIRQSAEGGRQPAPQRWQVERQGQVIELTVEPAVAHEQGQAVGRIEAVVGAPPEMDLVRHGPAEGLSRGLRRTAEMSMLTVKMFGRMLIGEASLRNISGPLTIADYAGQSVQLGLAYYLGFLAVVSVSLGVLNLLPLPMLDGGHLLYYLVEGVIGRPIPDVWIERLQRGGLVVILMMMSLALYNDVARLMGLH